MKVTSVSRNHQKPFSTNCWERVQLFGWYSDSAGRPLAAHCCCPVWKTKPVSCRSSSLNNVQKYFHLSNDIQITQITKRLPTYFHQSVAPKLYFCALKGVRFVLPVESCSVRMNLDGLNEPVSLQNMVIHEAVPHRACALTWTSVFTCKKLFLQWRC